MERRALLAAFGLVLLWTTAAAPQSFPSRPVKMVMTFAAGGPADLFTRVLANEMSQDLGPAGVCRDPRRRRRHDRG